MAGQLWEVVGGSDKGGILVRTGKDTSSAAEPERISTGALVRALELDGERLRYLRLQGTGPLSGWVSTKLKDGRDLLVQSRREPAGQLWDVVGGVERGGIMVRTQRDTASAAEPERLATGAVIRELESDGERVLYEKLTGAGPAFGWVSIRLSSGKDLLAKHAGPAPPPASPAAEDWNPYAILQLAPDATNHTIKRTFRQLSLKVHPDQNPEDPRAADKFRLLAEAKEFLLDPVKRTAFNRMKGYLFDTARNPVYWSDWRTMFDELGDPELEDAPSGGAAPGAEDGRFDILVLGCTALVGMLACGWLSKRPAGSATWAIAARTLEKLEVVAGKFGRGPNYRGKFHMPDPEMLDEILPRCKVILNYNGPPLWAKNEVVYALAVKHGVHYIDVTGDVPFVRDRMRELHEEAKRKGVIVLPSAGSGTALPCDLAVYAAVRRLRDEHGTPCRRAVSYSWGQGGGLSGNSFQAALDPDKREPDWEKDPFSLGGQRPCGVRPEDQEFLRAEMDGFSAMWCAPDSIGNTDARVVRRSCELFEKESPALGYGESFNIQVKALASDKMAASMAALTKKMPVPRREKFVEEQKVPPVGFGPSERLRQEAMMFKIVNAEGENGKEVHCVMSAGPGGTGDGYHGSGVVSAIVASVVVEELASLPPERRGFTTAAHLLGETRIWKWLAEERMVFSVRDGRAPQELFRTVMGGALALEAGVRSLEPAAGEEEHSQLPWKL